MNPRSAPVSPVRVGSVPVSPVRVGSVPVSPVRVGSVPVSPVRVGSVPVSPVRVGSVPVSPVRVGSVPVSPVRVGFAGLPAIDVLPDDLAAATAVVRAFVPRDRVQAAHRRRLLGFAGRHPDALHRSCEVGHLTASAWVVNHDATKGLVLLHHKIGRWLQPGGHADGEGSLAGVALREATEETGIDGLEIWTEPVDIDVHLFVNRRHSEPDHLHLDVRFLVCAPQHAAPSGNHESDELKWIARDQLDEPEMGLDASTRRLARYGFDLARTLGARLDG